MKCRTASMMVFVCLLSVAALPMVTVGQEKEESTGVAPNDETIEANAVVSQKSQADLRRDVYQAEEDFYALYNKLNDDKDYDVRCFYEKPTGTNIKNHICRARFVTKAYERHARRNRTDLSRIANQGAIPLPEEKTARYQEIMETLIGANPDLQAALVRYNSAQALYLAKREE